MQLRHFLFLTSLVFSLNVFSVEQKEWTFLVFINGHNNLSGYGDRNIRDMEKTGSTDQLNILVEWGSEKTNITKRLYVKKSTNSSVVTSPAVMEFPNYDMGNYRNFIDFVKWGVQNYPAKKYFVTIWNHGSGWHKSGSLLLNNLAPISATDISYDDHTGNKITTEQMGLALQEISQLLGRKVDIYGSDACLMQMIEIGAEIQSSVDVMLGSQELEPGEGWPYAPFIKKWAMQPTMNAEDVSRLLTSEYLKAYSKGGEYREVEDVTLSAVRLQQSSDVYKAIKNLGQNLMQLSDADKAKTRQATIYSTKFAYSDYVDLGDFAFQLKKLNLSSAVNQSAQEIIQSLKKYVISSQNGEYYPRATGISIWIPTRAHAEQQRYNQLQFSKETQWNEFLIALGRIN